MIIFNYFLTSFCLRRVEGDEPHGDERVEPVGPMHHPMARGRVHDEARRRRRGRLTRAIGTEVGCRRRRRPPQPLRRCRRPR